MYHNLQDLIEELLGYPEVRRLFEGENGARLDESLGFLGNLRGDSEVRRYFEERDFFRTAISDVYCANELIAGIKEILAEIKEALGKMEEYELPEDSDEMSEYEEDYVAEIEHLFDVVASQSKMLLSCIESMLSILWEVFEELAYLNRPD